MRVVIDGEWSRPQTDMAFIYCAGQMKSAVRRGGPHEEPVMIAMHSQKCGGVVFRHCPCVDDGR